ncbi:hypothetical protein N7519_000205 [Penicillium mononematosum]|uniref:uncharacterized protein n=1 Tax=Penicillium mononematosum TaxID=268346 RepID=UPI0025467968|nr:uncharacterized protein N7519_000205 [Penicillium mononematosum]KAJ6190184.1 hypothetical protein N7519_000205 [Penicillium mononematosum]
MQKGDQQYDREKEIYKVHAKDAGRRLEYAWHWEPSLSDVATYDYRMASGMSTCDHMKYVVGRACAVAGYTDLFHELDHLPDYHIAEEARESRYVATYDAIMKAAVKHNAMDDCTRAGRNSKSQYNGLHWAMDDGNCDIGEDRRVDKYDTDPEPAPFAIKDEEIRPMLYNPLTPDLPTLNKDLLIIVAAFYGDIDRYARLRRPKMAHSEYVRAYSV